MKLQIDGVDIATIDDADGYMLLSLFKERSGLAYRPTVQFERPEPISEKYPGVYRTEQQFTCELRLRGVRP